MMAALLGALDRLFAGAECRHLAAEGGERRIGFAQAARDKGWSAETAQKLAPKIVSWRVV